MDARIETTAQLIHEQAHRLGSAQVCQKCRDLAEQLARVYQAAPVTQ